MQKNNPTAKTPPQKPRFIYDGDCAFCRRWVHYSQQVTKDAVLYHAYQDVADEFPNISQNEFRNAVKLIAPDGTIWSGAAATFRTLAYNPNRTTLLWLYNTIPGFSILSEWAYRRISRHRDAALKVTEFFFGPQKNTHESISSSGRTSEFSSATESSSSKRSRT